MFDRRLAGRRAGVRLASWSFVVHPLGLLVGALMLLAAMAAMAGTAASAAVQQPADAWPRRFEGLAGDERVRYGTLPNGMRYALRQNARPPEAASLRLRIDVGSLHERADQSGLAHLLEHMALNETRNMPEGELIRTLERAGLQFGPDTNATTDFEQTVYMLDLPQTDVETVDTALFLMREAVAEATLSAEAIDRERGVVLSEERSRATPNFRMALDEIAFLYRGDLLAERIPIGNTEILRSAPRERLVELYRAFYRPERATLVAVGDFDLDEMEAMVRARFSDWTGTGAPGPAPSPPSFPERGLETRVFADPGVPTRVSMSWVAPLLSPDDTVEQRQEDFREGLAQLIVSRRIERLASSDATPLIGGAMVQSHPGHRAEVTQLVAVAATGRWREALAALEQEQRRIVEHGFTQAELDREINEVRARLTASVTGAESRSSAQIANGLVSAVEHDVVFTAPASDLALFELAVDGLTAEAVTAEARAMFEGSGPLIHLATPVPVEGGNAALAAAWRESRAVAVAAAGSRQAGVWPYREFGTPGEVVERREIAGTGATAVRFANGVRLTVRPTDFRAGEIAVAARIGGGQLGLATDRPSPLWGYAMGGFAGGGLGELSFEQVQEVLAGRVYGLAAGVEEDALTLGGKTRPEDFATQLQLLAAYVSDPGWRPTVWNRLRALSDTVHDQLGSSPAGILNRDIHALLRSGDPRWAMPSREEMAATTIEQFREIVGDDFAGGPIELIIVGDVSVEDAIRETAATFGALPPRRAPAAIAPAAVRFPAGGRVERTHAGRADQGAAIVAWPTAGVYADERRARGLNLLGLVLQLRILEEIRERQGASYSPQAAHQPSEEIDGYGYLVAQVELPPDRLDGFFADLREIAGDLREREIDEDELERARRPFLERLQRNRAGGNDWWVSQLHGVHERPERAESIREAVEAYHTITAADLRRLARQYLVDERAFEIAVRPAAAAATAGD